MKLKITLSMCLLYCLQLNAQNKNNFFKQLQKFNIPNTPATTKATRAANERCINILSFQDTSANKNMPIVLSTTDSMKYGGFRNSTTNYRWGMYFRNLNNNFDRSKTKDYLAGIANDTTFTVNTYDTSDRLIYSANLMYNLTKYDTVDFTIYKYTGINTIADSIQNFTVNPVTLNTLWVNKVLNNKKDSSFYYSSNSGTFALDEVENFKYNTSNGYISLDNIYIPSFGFGYQLNPIYNINNTLDSIKINSVTGGIPTPAQLGKIFYNSNNVDAYMHIWNLTTGTLSQGSILKLNANKKVVEEDNYTISPIDSTFQNKTIYNFNANNNITKVVNANFISSNWHTMDSTVYTYQTFTPLALADLSTIITNAILYPNPVNNNATILYNSSKNTPMQIVVTDVVGKQILNTTETAVNGNSFFTLDAQSWNTGIYICNIYANNILQQSIKINKQ